MTTEEVKNKYVFKPTELMYKLGEVVKELKEDVEYWYHDPKPDDPIMQAHLGYIGTNYLPQDMYILEKRRKISRSVYSFEELRRNIDRAIFDIIHKDERFFENYPIQLMCHSKHLHDTYIIGDTKGPIDDALLVMDSAYDNSKKYIYTDGKISDVEDSYNIKNYDSWDCRFFHVDDYHLILTVEDYYKDSKLQHKCAELIVY